ncbi:MAG: LapA family protein, partial [Desulfobacterales bacterium]
KQHIITVNLYFETYQTPEMPIAIFFLFCFLIGLLISYFVNLSEKFRSKKVIKRLSATLDSHLKKISELKNELESIKDIPSVNGTENTV